MTIRWQHVTIDSSHPVDPHHESTGEWVCYKCRQPVGDEGRKINMAFPATLARLINDRPQFVDPEQPGLQDEGS